MSKITKTTYKIGYVAAFVLALGLSCFWMVMDAYRRGGNELRVTQDMREVCTNRSDWHLDDADIRNALRGFIRWRKEGYSHATCMINVPFPCLPGEDEDPRVEFQQDTEQCIECLTFLANHVYQD